MNEGLEALKYISKQLGTNLVNNNYLQTIEKALKDKEKKDKALEIIKEKQVQVAILLLSNSCVGYNMTRGLLGEYLEQEEYDFLKEVLKDE